MSNIVLNSREVLNAVFSDGLNASTVKSLKSRLKSVCTPWEKDGNVPAGWVRKDGLGNVVGKACARLGGYGDPHKPAKHGVGFRAQVLDCSRVEKGIVTTGDGADIFAAAMNVVDVFLVDQGMRLLNHEEA